MAQRSIGVAQRSTGAAQRSIGAQRSIEGAACRCNQEHWTRHMEGSWSNKIYQLIKEKKTRRMVALQVRVERIDISTVEWPSDGSCKAG
jgi:hypothetical protein